MGRIDFSVEVTRRLEKDQQGLRPSGSTAVCVRSVHWLKTSDRSRKRKWLTKGLVPFPLALDVQVLTEGLAHSIPSCWLGTYFCWALKNTNQVKMCKVQTP